MGDVEFVGILAEEVSANTFLQQTDYKYLHYAKNFLYHKKYHPVQEPAPAVNVDRALEHP